MGRANPTAGRVLNPPRAALVAVPGWFTVRAWATHTRKLFGRLEYLVAPMAGTGEKWVTAENVTWETGGAP